MKNLIIILFLTFSAFGNIIYVSTTGSTGGDGSETSPYDSVQRGINEAVDGDTVLLEDGTYHEHNLHLFSKKIVLGSRFVLDGDTNHVDDCVIDGDSTNSDSGSVFCIVNPVDTCTKLVGFTVTKGTGTEHNGGKYGGGFCFRINSNDNSIFFNHIKVKKNNAKDGGGIYFQNFYNKITLLNCSILDNYASWAGGAILGGTGNLTNCKISNNYSNHYGGVFQGTTTYLKDCDIFNNEAGQQGGVSNGGTNYLIGCVIYNNYANEGGVFFESYNTLINCTVVNNFALVRGGGFCGRPQFSGNILSSCIFTDEFVGIDGTIIINSYYNILGQLINSSLSNDAIGNLFNLDPKFVDSANGDYHLLSSSPAIDAGHPDSSYANEPECDPPNTRINMGAYGNTSEATCKSNNAHMVFLPSSFSISVFRNEIKYDTLAVVNDNIDPMTIHDENEIIINDLDLICTGLSKTNTTLEQYDTCYIYLKFVSSTSRNTTIPIQINFESTNSGDIINYVLSMPDKDYDDLFTNDWNFSYVTVGVTHPDTFYLKNLGFNLIQIDSIREFNDYFALAGTKENFTIDSGDSITIAMTFSPAADQPYNTRIWLYSPNIDCIDSTLVVSGTGVTTDITISPDTLKFGDVLVNETDTSDQITIKNDNLISIDVTSITLGSTAYTLTGSSSFTLNPGEQVIRYAEFSPTVTGEDNSTMTIANTSMDNPSYVIQLRGKGVAPLLNTYVTTIPFGEVRAGTTKDDSLKIYNNGDGTLKIDSIRSDNSLFIVLGNDGYREVLPGDSSTLKVRFSPVVQSSEISALVTIYSNNSPPTRDITVTGTGTEVNVYPEYTSINFGSINLTPAFKDTTLTIYNDGNTAVTIDSVVFSNGAFTKTSVLDNIGANTSVPVTIRFTPQNAAGGDYSGTLRIYGEGSILVEVTLQGSSIGRPYCTITEITPASLPWDSVQTVSFLAAADDSDNAGTGARIVEYLWSSSLLGSLNKNVNSFTMKSSELGIGKHIITLKVVDNEGDTSDVSTDSVSITNRLPFAEIVSISPVGLIIKGGGNVTLTGRGHDLDEYANDASDSLKSFKWYSSIQGFLGDGKTITLNSATLDIGLHSFYIQVVDDEGDTATSASKSIPVQSDIGRVLMVAGTGFDDYYYFFSNISPNCNWAYKMAKDRGFTDDHIYYMNPVGWQSLDDPYTNSNIVDNTTMTLASMRNYLLSTDVINDVKNDVPLIIYLLGHGSQTQMNGKFYLNKTEVLTADTLAVWLDSYGDLASGNSQIVVILDFCYSGQFQQRLRTALSQNRFVITSSDPTHAAYFSRGRCFAWTIWRDVHRGENLSTGYSHALDWSNLNSPGGNKANPMLNCNSDGLYNTAADYALADNVYIGGNQQLQDVTSFVDSLTYLKDPIAKELTLTAHIRGDFTKLWCRIFTPDFDYTSGNIEQLPLFELAKVDASTYTGTYPGPWVLGNYMLKVDGTDENGNLVMGNAVGYNNDMVETLDTQEKEEDKTCSFVAVPNPADENSPGVNFYFISPLCGDVELKVFDALGNVVYDNSCQVDNKNQQVGTWDFKNRYNKKISGGVYLAVMRFIDKEGKVNLYKTKVGVKK